MAVVEKLNGADTLVIAITGYALKLNLPVNEFMSKAGLEHASKIVINDESKLQTLNGLQPEYPTFESLVNYLTNIIQINKFKSVIVTGTSGGGHPALLLGHLLKANYVVVFSPYPYLSISEFKKQKDPALQSMSKVIEMFDSLPLDAKKHLDLGNVLKDWNGVTQYYIHVSRYHKWDCKRAKYLQGVPGVSINSHPFSTHAIAASLASEKFLNNCFKFPYKSPKTIRYRFYLPFCCLFNRALDALKIN